MIVPFALPQWLVAGGKCAAAQSLAHCSDLRVMTKRRGTEKVPLFGFPPLIAEMRWPLSSSKSLQSQSRAFACNRSPSTPTRSGFRTRALSYAATASSYFLRLKKHCRDPARRRRGPVSVPMRCHRQITRHHTVSIRTKCFRHRAMHHHVEVRDFNRFVIGGKRLLVLLELEKHVAAANPGAG